VNMGVHDLVSAQATATPDAVAIVADDQQLSYRELDARANQLAHLLRSVGVGPDVPVGLCVERSLDLAIGALAILKAGGAYVPLDPSYPPNRLSTLLEESGASLLVAQSCVAKQLPVGRWRTIFLDAGGLATADYLNTCPVTGTKPGNLAFIIFTSGSTGRPKGVQITHASLLNLVSWHLNAFKVVRDDRATLQSSPFFTAAISLQPPTASLDLPWSVTTMDVDSGGSPWDFYLAFIDSPEGLIGRAQFNPDLFDTKTIGCALQDLQDVLGKASLESVVTGARIRADEESATSAAGAKRSSV
jgi:acyl-CoA synthetase (AMP-forming)/AMP-acid ligase II